VNVVLAAEADQLLLWIVGMHFNLKYSLSMRVFLPTEEQVCGYAPDKEL
jgi:hypothetical protein